MGYNLFCAHLFSTKQDQHLTGMLHPNIINTPLRFTAAEKSLLHIALLQDETMTGIA